jgi:hypothetical protein
VNFFAVAKNKTAPSSYRHMRVLLLMLIGVTAASAHPGWGIVVDRQGNIYYTDLKQVWRVTPDGKKSVAVPNVHTHELYLDSSGSLHGEHVWWDSSKGQWAHYLWELDGEKVVRASPEPGLRNAESFVRDRSGTMYWLEDRHLRKRALDGPIVEVTDLAQSPGVHEHPNGILTVTPEGTVYVAVGGDLLAVTPDCQVRRVATRLDEHVWTALVQPHHRIMGLAVDSGSNVFVANSGARKLKRVAQDGRVSVILRERLPWFPTGVAIHDGSLYVLEFTDAGNSARVRKLPTPVDTPKP